MYIENRNGEKGQGNGRRKMGRFAEVFTPSAD